MANPHHDISIRKRIHLKKQKYPHPNRAIASFDRFIIVLGLFNIIATLPQLLQIWMSKDAGGVSLFSWSYYTFFSLMLLTYGVIHREAPIIVNYGSAVALYAGIVLGVVVYS